MDAHPNPAFLQQSLSHQAPNLTAHTHEAQRRRPCPSPLPTLQRRRLAPPPPRTCLPLSLYSNLDSRRPLLCLSGPPPSKPPMLARSRPPSPPRSGEIGQPRRRGPASRAGADRRAGQVRTSERGDLHRDLHRGDAYLRRGWPRTQNACCVCVLCWSVFWGCKTL